MSVAYHDGMKQSRKCGSGSPSKATDGSGRDAAKMGTKTNTRTRAIIVVAAVLLIAAIVGTVLKIKPLLRGDDEGKIVQCGKTRGRKQSLTALADFYEKLAADKTEEIGIAHADDADGAQFLLDALRQRGFMGECLTVCYEPVTGSHVGPGTVALFFQGIHR